MNHWIKVSASTLIVILCLVLVEKAPSASTDASLLKALIVTGQCNPHHHNWKTSSTILKQLLEQTGLFKVDIAVSPPHGGDMENFAPNFAVYNVVVLDYEGDFWSEQTRKAFVEYVKSGGGVVIYHAASWSFQGWDEYNKIIGLRWGGDEKLGPYIRWRNGGVVRDTKSGRAGQHPYTHEFRVITRDEKHPITKGLPEKWMHGPDDLYSELRGPAENLTVLATAYADPKLEGANGTHGTGEHEPVLFTIKYGKGRVFHTTLGHVGPMNNPRTPGIDCVGFIVTFQRGAEWAATGKVTQKIPDDFPTDTEIRKRKLYTGEPNSSLLKALIVTGQCKRYHNWRKSSQILRRLLEQTELFKVDIARSPPDSHGMGNFNPNFDDYNVVVIDYEGDSWSELMKRSFVRYVKSGGGVVLFHSACWNFEDWDEYNRIIGLRWGGDEELGPYVRWCDGKVVHDFSPGRAGSHPVPHEFQVITRTQEHPITAGLPEKWMHGPDDLYSELRGPAENLTVLATAYADPKLKDYNGRHATGEHEPVLFTVSYGKGRIFHTVLGHVSPKNWHTPICAIECVGFIVTFQRGAEWAATGRVTQIVPEDFPTAIKVSRRE